MYFFKKAAKKIGDAARNCGNEFRNKLQDNTGSHTIEVVLVILVVLALVVIFRTQLLSIINKVFSQVNKGVESLY